MSTRANSFVFRPRKIKSGLEESLKIDLIIRSTQLQSRWTDVNEAVRFGRVAIQAALNDAIDIPKSLGKNEHEYWERVFDLSKSTNKSMRSLLAHIGPKELPSGQTFFPIWSKLGGRPKKIALNISLRTKDDGTVLGSSDAKEEKDVLSTAASILEKYTQYSQVRLKRLGPKKKGPRSQLGKHAFVYILVEAWVFLTGHLPGKGRTLEKNPFLRFVDAALSDIGVNQSPDMYTFLLPALDRIQNYPPDTTHQSVEGIRQNGPGWFAC